MARALSAYINPDIGSEVASITNSDGTLTISPNTGAVVASLALGHANTWTALQTFGNNISIGGASVLVTSLATNNVLQYNGTNWVNTTVTSNVAEKANASDTELTVTTATTVATFTPTAQGNFMVNVYYRVVTAATVLTLTATWDDGTGAQTYTWVNTTSQAVGSYVLAPVYVNATTAAAITITATAGTANQVYVSGTIIQIT